MNTHSQKFARIALAATLVGGCGGGPPDGPAAQEDQRVAFRVLATGLLPDESVDLVVDGVLRGAIRSWAPAAADFILPAGRHVITLAGVAENCVPPRALVLSVPLAGDSPSVNLALRCRGFGPLAGLEFAVIGARDPDSFNAFIGEGDSLRFLSRARSVAWAADGASLAIADGTQIRTFSRDGSGSVTVFHSEWERLSNVAWSPDQQEIAFTLCYDGNAAAECGPQVRAVTRQSLGWADRTILRNAANPVWAPDGSLLVVARSRVLQPLGPGDMFRPALKLPASVTGVASPAYSSDGRSIAYVGYNLNVAEIRLHAVGTDDDRPAGISMTGPREVAWLQGSAGLIVTAQSDFGRSCLFWVAAAGANPSPLLYCDRDFSGFVQRPQ